MVNGAGVQTNCNCIFVSKVKTTDQGTHTEMKVNSEPIAKKNPSAILKKEGKNKKTTIHPSEREINSDVNTMCDMETDELASPTSSKVRPIIHKSQKIPPILILRAENLARIS